VDVVLAISVLEHLEDDAAVLRETRRVLSDGGVLAVNVPTWLGKPFLEFSAYKLRLSPKEEMDDHKRYYNKRDLWPKLVSAGYRPSAIRLRYHKGGLNLFGTARCDAP
jgi:SAM-dependent methyltransferase